MVNRFHPSRSVPAAIGAALFFYIFLGGSVSIGTAPLVLFFSLCGACVLIGLLRTLPILISPEYQRHARYISDLIVLFSLGLCMGLIALTMVKSRCFAAPLQKEDINTVQLQLTTDLRTSQSGALFGQGKVAFCVNARGTRASSRGVINILIPRFSGALHDLAGQGSSLTIMGSFADDKADNRLNFQPPLFVAETITKIEAPHGLQNFRFFVRRAILAQFKNKEWGGYASALLLGVKDDLESEVSELYRKVGSSHVLALSGMHLSIIAALLAFVLRRPLGIRIASLLSLIILSIYVGLAGFPPSLVRSLIMYMLMCFMMSRGISGSLVSSIALSFLLQLFIDPQGMTSLSAMLSYMALAGIALLSPLVFEAARGIIPRFISAGISTSLGAFIFTAPLVAAVFGVLYPIGIILGSLLGALASFIMIGSIIYLLVSLSIPFLSPFVGAIIGKLYHVHIAVLQIGSLVSVELTNLNWKLVTICGLATTALIVYGQYRGTKNRTISSFN